MEWSTEVAILEFLERAFIRLVIIQCCGYPLSFAEEIGLKLASISIRDLMLH